MFIDSAIIAFAFRIINFIALAGLGYYVLRKYVIPTMKSEIINKEEELTNLQNRNRALAHQYEQLADEIQLQEKEGSVLLEKVKQWRKVVSNLDHIQDEEYQLLRQQAQTRIEQQALLNAQKELQRFVIPEALTLARTRLIDEFKDEARNGIFLKELIAHLPKK